MNKFYTQLARFVFLFGILILPGSIFAQGDQEYTPEKIEAYKADVQNLIDFLEYSFNTLGSAKTSARDKDVIINQSYAKIFANPEVQIEDDLDDNRETLINKDVQAYLKDIDFFFKQAVFSFNVSKIEHHFTNDKELYFVATLNRTLNARTIDGDTVSSVKERFIEVNYNDLDQDLRIVSIYTTKIDEKDELFAWWNKMSHNWHEIIAGDAYIFDTILLADVVTINDTMAIAEYWGQIEVAADTSLIFDGDSMNIDDSGWSEGLVRDSIMLRKGVAYRLLQRMSNEIKIDISGNLNIQILSPLAQMGKLQEVNCSNTLIDDLGPLRNLINIESLDCSGTPVTSIAPLQYSLSLKRLDVSNTRIADGALVSNLRNLEILIFSNTPTDSINALSSMTNLRDLRFDNTYVSDLSPLSGLINLQIINASGSYIKDLSPLEGLTNLERLYISNTSVSSLDSLSELNNLQTIYLDSTSVNSLQPLSGLAKLESIYCDNTGIKSSKANEFMAENPNVIVVFESTALTRWWNSMSAEWKRVFGAISVLDEEPSKEQLHEAAKIKEIDISGHKDIKDLTPLKSLTHFKSLDCSNTGIDNLWPLADLVDLQMINCAGNPISNCDPLRDLISLRALNISNTEITELQCISRIKNLEELNIEQCNITDIAVIGESGLDIVYADGSGINLESVKAFKEINPDVTVIYQTEVLNTWWASLLPAWKDIFSGALGLKKSPGPKELQQMADLEEIDLGQKKGLGSLQPLQVLYRLKVLKMNDTQISDLSPLAAMRSLEKLIISDNPIEDIAPLAELLKLKHLEFENTPVDDLEPLVGLVNLEILNMAGTQIKKLNEISTLTSLKQISFYNTPVKSLSPLDPMLRLEVIKCYNTKLSSKKVKKFGEGRSNCEIIFY